MSKSNKKVIEKKHELLSELQNPDIIKSTPWPNLKLKKPLALTAKTENQRVLFKSIKDNLITFAVGAPGSGKTLISVNSCLNEFMKGNYKKMIFTRPCVEASGENLGFLPGNLNEKIYPYMMPIFDFLGEYLEYKQIELLIRDGFIQTLPLAYMRGMTWRNAFVLLDECLTGDTKVNVFINGKEYKAAELKFVKKYFSEKNKIQISSYNTKTGEYEFKDILNFFDNGVKEIFKIYLNNNRTIPIKATKNHPFALLREGEIQWMNTENLKVGDSLIRNSYKKNNNSFILNKNNYDIALGTLLGDGCLSQNESQQLSYRVMKTHGMAQYEYMLFCMSLFHGKERHNLKSGYTQKPLCGFAGQSCNIGEDFINALYKNKRKTITKEIENYFTDRSLALFYMDDGSIDLRKTSFSIIFHTEGFSLEENNILKFILDKKYEVNTKIRQKNRNNKTYYVLAFDKDDSSKLLNRIKQYIHPQMYYKLPEEYRDFFDEKLYFIDHNFNNVSVSTIQKIEAGVMEPVYNIEVKENNNFFANNILVHNCQNTKPEQMKMFLTRIGENCKIVVTGDPKQSDVKGKNGLIDAIERFANTDNIGIVEFTEEDILRHPMVAVIEKKYNGCFNNGNSNGNGNGNGNNCNGSNCHQNIGIESKK